MNALAGFNRQGIRVWWGCYPAVGATTQNRPLAPHTARIRAGCNGIAPDHALNVSRFAPPLHDDDTVVPTMRDGFDLRGRAVRPGDPCPDASTALGSRPLDLFRSIRLERQCAWRHSPEGDV